MQIILVAIAIVLALGVFCVYRHTVAVNRNAEIQSAQLQALLRILQKDEATDSNALDALVKSHPAIGQALTAFLKRIVEELNEGPTLQALGRAHDQISKIYADEAARLQANQDPR